MEEKILKELENSQFNENKYYIEIIKNFINEYSLDKIRIEIKNDNIHIKASDIAGSRDIYFALKNNNLIIKVDRNVDLKKYQDIIIYNSNGIMIERSRCLASLKKEISEKIRNNSEILLYEFDKLGQSPSMYTGKIFDEIDFKCIKRDISDSICEYNHHIINYNDKGLGKGMKLEGNYELSMNNNILEFPLDEQVRIINLENLEDTDIYTYPNYRSL